jgi:hypothetical protein
MAKGGEGINYRKAARRLKREAKKSAKPLSHESIKSSSWLTLFASLLQTFWIFARALIYFCRGGAYEECPTLRGQPLRTRVHLYHLALNFWLWDRPHYRTGTHQGDMLKNLRNVAVPGTGVPMHLFVLTRPLAYWFLFVAYPCIALAAAVHRARLQTDVTSGQRLTLIIAYFKEQLLAPQDWFTYWRMNSNLASYHSLLSGARGYRHENKWTFFEGRRRARLARFSLSRHE